MSQYPISCVSCGTNNENEGPYIKMKGTDDYLCDICKYVLSSSVSTRRNKHCRYNGTNENKITCGRVYPEDVLFCIGKPEEEKEGKSLGFIIQNICVNCLVDEFLEEGKLSCNCEVCQEIIEMCSVCPK